MTDMLTSLDELAARVPDGALVAIPPDYSGCAMAAVRRVIARAARGLHLVGVPSGGLQADWLIGAGCVGTMEAAALTLGEFGLPPRFAAALKAGTIATKDATCPVIHAGLQAAEKGIPFMPLRGVIGSDLAANRPDWKIIDNPFSAEGAERGDPILLFPAIRPDVTLFHAPRADRCGNVWVGVRRELMLMAHASRSALVTVETVEDTDFLADPVLAAGTIPALYIDAIAEARNGAWPVGLAGEYPADRAAIAAYVEAAQTQEGFDAWLKALETEAEAA
ncbi:CoA transferase subunit A [Futiania mangrovi]|uniref:CoA synthetase n=1 Tax=Futiania mangrovi TaxID=2959716 RepID=A0A9J6PBP0_9PROT|nr:CoA-transferase [Futiania mangrovii]MCP1336653.1 CoA synthetase [Futiania mangrovii]